MALPTITAPPGTPVFLAAGHQHVEDSAYAQVRPTTGHSRARRVWTTTERVVAVSWLLSASQMAAVDAWFEDDLEAGALEFAAQVANLGPGLLWYRARWISFETELLNLGRGRVSGTLLLIGEGTATPPETGALAAEISARLVSVPASFSVPVSLAAEISVPLENVRSLAAEIAVALISESFIAYGFLREDTDSDGQFILREDGARILRE